MPSFLSLPRSFFIVIRTLKVRYQVNLSLWPVMFRHSILITRKLVKSQFSVSDGEVMLPNGSILCNCSCLSCIIPEREYS